MLLYVGGGERLGDGRKEDVECDEARVVEALGLDLELEALVTPEAEWHWVTSEASSETGAGEEESERSGRRWFDEL